MSDNFGIGNKFDAAWKDAKQVLLSQGNTKPTTQDILHYLINKWKPQQDTTKILVQGLHIEHTDAPVMKYGANIGCTPQQDTVPQSNIGIPVEERQVQVKYGANIGCTPVIQDEQQVNVKYGANISCKPQVQEDSIPEQPQLLQLKYGVNLNPRPVIISDSAIHVKYGANIGCSPVQNDEQQVNVKYGANIGCGKKKFKVSTNPAVQKIIDAYRNNRLNNVKSITVDREAGTFKVKKEISE